MVLTRAKSGNVLSIEQLLDRTTNIDEQLGNSIVVVCSVLKRLEVNYPCAFNDVRIIESSISELIKCLDESSNELNGLRKVSEQLKSDKESLELLIKQERSERRSEFNDSLNDQDTLIEERNTILNKNNLLQNSLNKCKTNISSLELDIVNLQTLLKEKDSVVNSLGFHNGTLKAENAKLNDQITQFNVVLNKTREQSWMDSRWVDDGLLSSYFETFSKESQSDIMFLGPPVVELIKHGEPVDVKAQLTDLQFISKEYVFCCVSNGSAELVQDSGSHWSLLFIDRVRNVAYHLDSSAGLNSPSAKHILYKLGLNEVRFVEPNCPQQRNGFECGVNVLINARLISNAYCNMKSDNYVPFEVWYKSVFFGGTVTGTRGLMDGGSVPTVVRPTAMPGCAVRQTHIYQERGNINKNPHNEWTHVKTKKQKLKGKRNNTILTQMSSVVVCKNRYQPLEVRKHKKCNNFIIEDCKQDKTPSNLEVTDLKVKSRVVGENGPFNVTSKQTSNHNNNKCKVILLSDSHGRALSENLSVKCPASHSVTGIVKPSGKLCHVTSDIHEVTMLLGKQDTLIVFGGTNDIEQCDHNVLFEQVETISKVTSHTNLIFIGIPKRLDNPLLNNKIVRINFKIHEIIKRFPHAQFISTHSLYNKSFYSSAGVHFNYLGKRCIVNYLHKALFPCSKSHFTPLSKANDNEISFPKRKSTFLRNGKNRFPKNKVASQVFINSHYFLDIDNSTRNWT